MTVNVRINPYTLEKDWLIDKGVATQFIFGSWNTNAINLKYLFSDVYKVTISGG